MARSPFLLIKNRKLAVIMNTNVFHLKMIDLQDEMLKETSDLSVYCFYIKTLERQWKSCLTLPSQSRFALCFARICGHFSSALHDMCPEEKNHILEKSLALCNSILDDVCQSITDVVGALCEYELRLAEQTSPSTIAAQIVSQMLRTKGGKNAAAAQKDPAPAGEESYRVDRQTLTYPDKLQTTLIPLDITRLFNNVLLQQTQPLDSRNKETMTYIYTKWYLEVVLRRASAGHMLWSEHLQAMISSGEGIEFAPEQYTDPRELRCLAQIIGPYGVKYLAERLTWHVASQIGELNK
ncbi:unnamed protein product, partial [Cylicostephanus goldi]